MSIFLFVFLTFLCGTTGTSTPLLRSYDAVHCITHRNDYLWWRNPVSSKGNVSGFKGRERPEIFRKGKTVPVCKTDRSGVMWLFDGRQRQERSVVVSSSLFHGGEVQKLKSPYFPKLTQKYLLFINLPIKPTPMLNHVNTTSSKFDCLHNGTR